MTVQKHAEIKIMEPYRDQALSIIQDAKKKLTPGFFSALFGWKPKIESAVEAYHRAGNLFKMSKNWYEAGNAFLEAGRLCMQIESNHEAATSFVDAANCFKKTSHSDAVQSYLRAIDIYTDMGKFALAAKYHVLIAEIFEQNNDTIDKAIQHFEQASDYYLGEEHISFGNKYLLKVAHYSAQAEMYDKAINIYENVASVAIANPLLKYSAKEHLFRAGLCHLCINVSTANKAMERYVNMHPSFEDSRECKFLKSLIDCCEKENSDEFSQCIANYDSISKIDDWHTTILLRIKRKLSIPDIR